MKYLFVLPLGKRQVMEIVAEDLAPKKTYSDLVEMARDDQVGEEIRTVSRFCAISCCRCYCCCCWRTCCICNALSSRRPHNTTSLPPYSQQDLDCSIYHRCLPVPRPQIVFICWGARTFPAKSLAWLCLPRTESAERVGPTHLFFPPCVCVPSYNSWNVWI